MEMTQIVKMRPHPKDMEIIRKDQESRLSRRGELTIGGQDL